MGASIDDDLPVADGATGRDTALRELACELRLLCRGLADTHIGTLHAVSTVVRCPIGSQQEAAPGPICERLAAEFSLLCRVSRTADGWTLRFSRPVPSPGLRVPAPVSARLRAQRGLLAGLGRLREAAPHPPGATFRPQPFPS